MADTSRLEALALALRARSQEVATLQARVTLYEKTKAAFGDLRAALSEARAPLAELAARRARVAALQAKRDALAGRHP